MIVVYSPKMFAKNPDSLVSPSASKPTKAVRDWKAHGIPMRIVEPEPLTPEEIAIAHDPEYVKNVLSCRIDNGFGNKDPEVAASLPYTSGGLYTAAKLAIREKAIVCAPVSGFHHASFGSAWGFCTFNGLMITSLLLLERGEAQSVGIIDCDMHYGNGTDNILQILNVPRERIFHFSAGKKILTSEKGFFRVLKKKLEKCSNRDVVLYQAGADPHKDDPLGGYLTTEELKKRDKMVFDWSRTTGVPVVWNLAGGYQRDEDGGITKTLEIHRNTALLAQGSEGNELEGSV